MSQLVGERMRAFPASGEINRKVKDAPAVIARVEAEYTPGARCRRPNRRLERRVFAVAVQPALVEHRAAVAPQRREPRRYGVDAREDGGAARSARRRAGLGAHVPAKRARRAEGPKPKSFPASLRDPRCFGAGVSEVGLVETHVSWVFLTGRHAYKVKKPVKLPFVDFSTLKLRKRFCDEELRVNRRLAPELYLGVVPIGGTPSAPRVGRKPAFEYAVKMREFATADRLDRRLAAKRLPKTALAEFGAELARFHCRPPARARHRGRRRGCGRDGTAQHRRARAAISGRAGSASSSACALGPSGSARAWRRSSRGAPPQARIASVTATCIYRTCSGATARSSRSTRSSSTASCATSTSSARSPSSRWTCAHTAARTSRTSS